MEAEDDQDVLCALGGVTKSDSPASDSFDLVAGFLYNFDKEAPQADQHLFNRFKKIRVEKSIKTEAEVIDALHENTLYEIAPEFSKVASVLGSFGRHSHNIMLQRKVCSADSRRLKT